jgi:DNA-binding CsgD family transcriptional regulator
MALPRSVDRALTSLAGADAPFEELGDRCLDVLGDALPFDLAVWFALDPATLLPTRFVPRFPNSSIERLNRRLMEAVGVRRAFELQMMRRMMRTEWELDDSLCAGALVGAPGHVATLHGVTGGDPRRSPRHATYPRGADVEDEARVLFTDAGEAWGMAWLVRRAQPFDDAERKLLSAVGKRLGAIVRMTFLRAAVRETAAAPDPPGLLLVGEDGRAEDVSPEARHLLGGDGSPDWLPVLRETAAKHGQASLVVEGAAGSVTVHACRFGARDAVIVERARPAQVADRLVRAYGLTPRERDVVGGLSKGWSTRRIAFELDLADYTVQDHLRAVFDKVGVRSRKEVVAKLFFERYVPEHRANTPPSPYGFFLDTE